MQETYTIAEVAERTGLSKDTLRYYEKIGLLASPARGTGRSRLYGEEDIGRIQFLNHLRRTDMPLKKIKAYVERYDQGDADSCYLLLDQHRLSIERQLAELNAVAEIIRYKLDHFQSIQHGYLKET